MMAGAIFNYIRICGLSRGFQILSTVRARFLYRPSLVHDTPLDSYTNQCTILSSPKGSALGQCKLSKTAGDIVDFRGHRFCHCWPNTKAEYILGILVVGSGPWRMW